VKLWSIILIKHLFNFRNILSIKNKKLICNMQKEAGIPKKIIDDIPGLSKYLIPNLSLVT